MEALCSIGADQSIANTQECSFFDKAEKAAFRQLRVSQPAAPGGLLEGGLGAGAGVGHVVYILGPTKAVTSPVVMR
jgi:hypothetical protein